VAEGALVEYTIFVTYLLWLIIGRRIHTRGLVGGLNPKKILHTAPSASGSIPFNACLSLATYQHVALAGGRVTVHGQVVVL
jgi:hypothetical protein